MWSTLKKNFEFGSYFNLLTLDRITSYLLQIYSLNYNFLKICWESTNTVLEKIYTENLKRICQEFTENVHENQAKFASTAFYEWRGGMNKKELQLKHKLASPGTPKSKTGLWSFESPCSHLRPKAWRKLVKSWKWWMNVILTFELTTLHNGAKYFLNLQLQRLFLNWFCKQMRKLYKIHLSTEIIALKGGIENI